MVVYGGGAERGSRPAEVSAAAVAAAATGALAMVGVGAALVSADRRSPEVIGSIVLLLGAAAAVVSVSRASRSVCWIGSAGAAAATIGLAVGGGAAGWERIEQVVDRSLIEVGWLAGALALVAATHRVGDRLDGSRFGLSRVDGAIMAVSLGMVLALVLGPELSGTGVARGIVMVAVAHAVVAVLAVGVATRAYAVTPRDPSQRLLLAGTVLFASAGLCRVAGPLHDVQAFGDVAAMLTVVSVGLLLLAPVAPGGAEVDAALRRPGTDIPDERVASLALAATAPPLVAAVQYGRGLELNVTLFASGLVLLLLLVVARLHLMIRAVREQADRETVVRQTAGRVAQATDLPTIRAAVVDAVAMMLGPSLRFVVWAEHSPSEGYEFHRMVVDNGPQDPERLGLLSMVDEVSAADDATVHFDIPGGEAVGATILELPWRGLIVACRGRLPADFGDALRAVATQSAMAVEGIRRAEQLLVKRSEDRFQELVRHTNDAVFIVDAAGHIRYQTPSVVRVLGYLAVDLDGEHVERLVMPDATSEFRSYFNLLTHSSDDRADVAELELLRADGTTVQVEMVGSNLLSNPDVAGVVLTVRDVSRRRELEAQLRHQAFHDSLTGLANRSLFRDRLEHALEARQPDTSPVPAMAFIDLDDFKHVNDSLGHAAGDQLLKVVSRRISSCIRSGDTAARLGGDEFAILFEAADGVEVIIEVTERLRKVLQRPVVIDDQQIRIRASIGIATRRDGSTATDLLRCADLAMYAAKRRGKGCVELFEPWMHASVVSMLSTTSDLEDAVRDETLTVAYQPLIDLDAGDVVGFEALVRWDHAERGPVPPSEFIPIAEEVGLIGELGAWVLREACEQLAAWRVVSRRDLRMHVNISVRQLDDPRFVDTVTDIVAATGIPSEALVLEVTESVLADDEEVMLDGLERLHATGVRIAIDDFGTGYSSLSYLRRLPLDILKIDRVFVSSLADVEPGESLVQTIIELSDRLGVETVAEGIERTVERDSLVALGCRRGQGFLFGSAVDARSATTLVTGGLRVVADGAA